MARVHPILTNKELAVRLDDASWTIYRLEKSLKELRDAHEALFAELEQLKEDLLPDEVRRENAAKEAGIR